MSDLQLLFLVLVLLYAWECACWLRRGSVAFRFWLVRRWQPIHPGTILGNQRGGFVFAPPLPPLGNILVGSQFPLSLSPDAVLAHVAAAVNPGGRPPQSGRLFAFAEIRSVEARGKKLRVNGEVLLKAGSTAAALHLCETLQRLVKLSPAKRTSAIERLFADSLDVTTIERLWDQFQSHAARLRLLTNLLFAYLFVAAPLLIWRFGLSRTWPPLLLLLLVATISIAVVFRRAHAQLYPTAADERFSHCLMLTLYPALAIRARDLLSRPLFEAFHPLALAKVFCSDSAFREFASRVVREIQYPALPLCPRTEPAAQEAERYSRQTLSHAVQVLLERSGIKPPELLPPPEPADETCRSFCPRCLAQFTTPSGQCADCGGVALCPFTPRLPQPRQGAEP